MNKKVASRANSRPSAALFSLLLLSLQIAWLLPASAAPANDLFANRITITGTNTSVTGSNLNASKELGEPNHADDSGGNSVWWTWTAPASGIVIVRTDGSSFDTLLEVYTNTSLASLSALAADDDSGIGFASTVIFGAQVGGTYQIAVDGFDGDTGSIQLQLSLDVKPTNDLFATATTLTTNRDVVVTWTGLATKEAGEPNHAGFPGGRSLWWRWTAPRNGVMVVSTAGSNFDTLMGIYTGTSVNALSLIAQNDDATDNNRTSFTNFSASAGTTYRIAVDGYNGAGGGAFLNYRFEPPPPNDAFANAVLLTGPTNVVFGTNVGATKELGEPDHAGNAGGGSVWWRWTAAASTPVTISTANSTYDTLLAVYTGNAVNALSLVVDNDDVADVRTSEVTFTPVAGTVYSIAVDGWASRRGDVQLAIGQEAPPGISVTLDGVNEGAVFNDTSTISLVPSVAGAGPGFHQTHTLSIYDDNTLIFVRPFNLADYSYTFSWQDPPLGTHHLRTVVVDEDESGNLRTNQSGITTITVVGADLGFSSLTGLQTSSPPLQDADTTVGCQLGVRNLTATATNPLRVRVLRKQTRAYLDSGSVFAPSPLNETFLSFQSLNPSLVAGGSFNVSIPLTANIVCPASFLDFGDSPADHIQFHLYAVLEEQIGVSWTLIGQTKFFSSVPRDDWFPFNDGPVPAQRLANTNLFAYLTNLFISGPTNLGAGTSTNFTAVGQLSDSLSGTVQPIWTGDPFPIGPTGSFTAPNLPTNATLKVIATFTRDIITRTATGIVTIARTVIPPSITAQPQSVVTNPGSNVAFSVTATDPGPLRYQWRRNGANIVNATNTTLPLLAVQYANAGVYSVIVSNSMTSVLSSNATLTLRPTLGAQGRLANGSYQLRLTNAAGSTFAIEGSTNLQTNSWIVLTNVVISTSPFLFTDPVTNLPRRFYRGRLLP